jgi:ankyrin repeat protein
MHPASPWDNLKASYYGFVKRTQGIATMFSNTAFGAKKSIIMAYYRYIRRTKKSEESKLPVFTTAPGWSAKTLDQKVALLNSKPDKYKNMLNVFDAPLITIATRNQQEGYVIVPQLIKYGADINKADKEGKTALMYAINLPNPAIFNRLLSTKGININSQNIRGNTALMIAAARGKGTMVKRLIEKKAQLILKNNNDKTALDIAADVLEQEQAQSLKDEEKLSVEALLKALWAKVLINKLDDKRNTILMRAAERGHSAMVELLIDKTGQLLYGIDKTMRNSTNETAEQIAQKKLTETPVTDTKKINAYKKIIKLLGKSTYTYRPEPSYTYKPADKTTQEPNITDKDAVKRYAANIHLLNAYQVLGINADDASQTKIKQAYKKLSRKWHPDKHLDNKENATIIMQRINWAKSTLLGTK